MTPLRSRVSRVNDTLSRVVGLVLPGFIRRNFAAKFFAGIILVLVITGSVGAFNYLSVDEKLGANAERELVATAELQSGGLNRWVKNAKLQARMLSNQETFDGSDEQEMALQLEDTIYSGVLSKEVEAIHYMSLSTSTVIVSSESAVKGMNLRQEGVPWAQKRLDTRLYNYDAVLVSQESYESPTIGTDAIALISPAKSNPDYAIVLIVNATAVADIFHQTSNGAYTEVLTASGEPIISQQANTVDGRHESNESEGNQSVVEDALEGNSGYRDNAENVIGYAPIDAEEWVVVTHAPKATVFSLKDQVTWSILTTILASVMVLGVIAVIGGNAARSLRRLSGGLKQMEEGDLQVELVCDREDEIGRVFGASASMRDSLRETLDDAEDERTDAEIARREAEQARTLAEEQQVEAERATREAEAASAHLETMAEQYRQVMDDCADGDLTRRMNTDSESEAMVAIAESFNEMVAEWETTLGTIRTFANEVAGASQTMTTSTEEISAAGQAVSSATREMSEGTQEQSESLGDISGEISSLSATIEEMAASADEVATTSRRAAERGEDGREAAAAAAEEMSAIEARAQETAAEVTELREEITHIGEIVGLIEDIAEKTNILALNAAIEAARAGDAGAGFAVVAAEVKTLAEETKTATEDVTELIGSVQDQADSAATGMRNMESRVDEGTATIEDAIDALEGIVEGVGDANAGVQEIRAATNEQATSTQEVVVMADTVADVADEMTGEAQNAATAAEQQATSLDEVADSADELAHEAADLTTLLGEFKVGDVLGRQGENYDVEQNENVVDSELDSTKEPKLDDNERIIESKVNIFDTEEEQIDEGNGGVRPVDGEESEQRIGEEGPESDVTDDADETEMNVADDGNEAERDTTGEGSRTPETGESIHDKPDRDEQHEQ